MDDFFTARVEGYDEHMRRNIEGASAFSKYIDVFYKKALSNLSSYRKFFPDHQSDIRFVETSASAYNVPSAVNRIFFFNPFSIEILTGTMKKILQSLYGSQETVYLFFLSPGCLYGLSFRS